MQYPNISILGSNGDFTGEAKSFSEIHSKGYWHGGVHVWVMNDKNELLLQKRGPNVASHPNMWDPSASGHIDEGESNISTAIKEVEEEIGLKTTREEFEHLFRFKETFVLNSGAFISNEFVDVYLIRCAKHITEFQSEGLEVTDIKFMHYKDLENLVNAKDDTIVPHYEEYDKLFEILHKMLDE